MYKILLVEDDPTITEVLERQLAKWGYEASHVTDFQHVLETFVQQAPHLVLLDISLPFYDGYHWCGEIRKISKTPVLFISSVQELMTSLEGVQARMLTAFAAVAVAAMAAALVFSRVITGPITRLTRTSLVEVQQQDYIRTARSKGISEFKVIYKHALRNALLPVVTYIGPMVASIVTGSFVIETVFGIPGVGQLFTDSIVNRDYPLIMGITVFFAVLLVLAVLIVDLVYVLIDPRIKLD